MKKEQVLILYENPLFAESLRSILSQEGVWKIEGLLGRRENGRRLIKTLRPNVVIIEGSSPKVDADSVLRELLKYSASARVISVDLDRNDAVVYIGLQLAATESNLIKAVKMGSAVAL